MDFKQFYQLSNKDTRGMFYASSKDDLDSYKLFRGELELNSPIKFYPNIGKKIYDVVGTGYAVFDLFSSNIINVLVENQITGWKTYPLDERNVY
ncbi:MAG: hypothetical protein LBQ60_05890 [Bacteroidales bacterium]|jgi:hypothetical protein|nr:hypothetical protein [Bacteroidales bacterium]